MPELTQRSLQRWLYVEIILVGLSLIMLGVLAYEAKQLANVQTAQRTTIGQLNHGCELVNIRNEIIRQNTLALAHLIPDAEAARQLRSRANSIALKLRDCDTIYPVP